MSETVESCPVCGFVWDSIDPDEVTPRIRAAIGQMTTLLVADAARAGVRPDTDRWSVLEYGAHVRDVLLSARDRLILAAIEDNPSPYPIHRDERVRLGLYRRDTPEAVAGDLEVAARLFEVAFDTLRPAALERPIIYSRILGDQRTFAWTGAQGLHEVEHHLDDMRDNVARLDGRT